MAWQEEKRRVASRSEMGMGAAAPRSRMMGGRAWLWVSLLAMAAGCEGKHRAFGPANDPMTGIGENKPADGGGDGLDAAVGGMGGSNEQARALRAMPQRVDFGAIPLGFAARSRVDFANSGETAVTIAELMLIDGSSEFAVTQNDCTAPLEPMTSCSVSLAFQPAQVGPRSSALQVATDALRVLSVPLAGEGLESSPFILEAAPESSVSFGDVLVNTERVQIYRLTNPTSDTSGLLDFSVSHPAFSLSLLDAAASGCVPQVTILAGGASCDVGVRFAPTERGPAESTLTARIGNAATSLNLSGNALIPAALAVAIAELDFGSIERLGTAALEVAIENAGDQELAPVEATISGANAAEFTIIANGCSQPLAPASTCNVSVSFTPVESGERSALLQLDSGAAGASEVTLLGQGVEPGDLLISAADGSSTSFGSVLLGATSEQTFRVTNPGDVPTGLITFTLNSGEFSLVPPSDNDCVAGITNLMGRADCDIRVRFSPTQRQQRNATLTVSSESLGSKSMNVSGIGLAPAQLDAPGSADFGRIAQGSASTQSLTVENLGDEPLGAVTATLSGQHQGDFVVELNDCSAGVGLGEGCAIAVGFTPRGTGSRLATLRLQSTPGGSRDVRLEGVGLVPGALTLTPAAGSTAEFTMALVLGSGQSQTQTFVLTNTGEVASGTINIPAVGNGFQVLSPTGTDCRSNTTNLQGGATCTLRVQFTPVVRGPNSASLSVSSPNAGSPSLGLRGTGLAAAQLVVDPQQLTFTNAVTVGQSALQTVTVRNNGDVAATTPTTQVAGPNAGEFAVATTTCGASIVGGATCTITIEFEPGGSGSRGATLRLRGSAAIDVALTGTGQRPGALVLAGQPGNPNFGTLVVDGSRIQTFTLTNSGDLSSGTIVNVTLAEGFTREPAASGECSPGSTVLDGGESCTIRVRFQPRAARAFDITMSVTSQNAGGASLRLTGVGQAAARLVAAQQLSFPGIVEVGAQSAPIEWRVSNDGGTATGQLSLSNNNDTLFVVTTNGCTGALAAGASCTVSIQFRPNAVGDPTARLALGDGAGASASVTVTGRSLLGNGRACTAGSQCSSTRCVDQVCCASVCNGLCASCRAGTGACDVMPADDPGCGEIECDFDLQCSDADATSIESNRCRSLGQCKTPADCEFTPFAERTACDTATSTLRICDGEGSCANPGVQCGQSSCAIGANVCCSTLQPNGTVTRVCTAPASCPATILTAAAVGTPAVTPISCDNDNDCRSTSVCCLTGASSGSSISCVNPAICNVEQPFVSRYQICRAPGFTGTCPAGRSCTGAAANFPDWVYCVVSP